jgi:hypothetical protein
MNRERLKGHLDLLLLSVLAAGPAHGYAIITALRGRSEGMFDLPEVAVISSTTESTAPPSWCPFTTTLAPSAARASAMARPMLRPEPVTTAVRPASDCGSRGEAFTTRL